MDKELRKLIDQLELAGFEVGPPSKRNGHRRVYSPEGEWLTTLSGRPSDWRTRMNELRPVTRRGFRWRKG